MSETSTGEMLSEEEEVEPEERNVHSELLGKHGQEQQKANENGERLAGEIIFDDAILNAQLHKLGFVPYGIAVEITAYNPTEPVVINGEKFVFARVEPTGEGDADSKIESESQSYICVLKEKPEGGWELVEAPTLHLQDPFYCGVIEGKHIFGGVETREKIVNGRKNLDYHTVFYSFEDSLREAQRFMSGPDKMKGIRIVERPSKNDPDKKVLSVLYRSQGEVGGRGEIGHFNANNLEEVNQIFRQMEEKEISLDSEGKPQTKLSNPDLQSNTLIKDLCGKEEWVGGNEIHLLADGNLGIIGHLAYNYPDPARRMNPQNPSIPLQLKRYVATAMIINPDTNEVVQSMKIICTAEDFPEVRPKKDDLDKIFYPGGLIRNGDGTAIIYGGIGDIKAGRRTIKDPFWDYERKLETE